MMHFKFVFSSLSLVYPQKKTTELPHERCCAFLNDDEGGRRLAGAAVMVVVLCFLFYLSS